VKFFNSLEAWRIERIGAVKSAPSSPAQDDNDRLPF
jgi:hypothetical protein